MRARWNETCLQLVHMNSAARGSLSYVAYLSMEIALDSAIPSYAGGLGVLAGDLLRSAADLSVPMLGVSLLYRAGHFTQKLDANGNQEELPVVWAPEERLRPERLRVYVEIGGRAVALRSWRYDLIGKSGHVVPVYFLDADLPDNDHRDRALTGTLYGGDAAYRLGQEIVLGIGSARLLAALYPGRIRKLHLNEGHSALAAWATLGAGHSDAPDQSALAEVRRRCVFTTHTPVRAGQDHFARPLVEALLPAEGREALLAMCGAIELDMTRLALHLCGYVNAVSARHRRRARELFPDQDIHHVTNGVHHGSWTCASMTALLDRHVPGWGAEPSLLRKALAIPDDALWSAHGTAKAALLHQVREQTGVDLDPRRLTLGFARRAATYKRIDLLFSDLPRLRALGSRGLQVVLGGKAHPRDEEGKQLIRKVFAAARELGPEVRVVYLPDYGLASARLLTAGVDVWLNTPVPPLEGCGTSGMKAACNGVPSLSTLDGWWCEGHVEGVTGWAIEDAAELYDKLERLVLPAYADRGAWSSIMKHCLAINAAYFNTHRALQQYLATAYTSGSA